MQTKELTLKNAFLIFGNGVQGMRVIVFSYIRLFAEALTSCIKAHSDKFDITFCQESSALSKDIQSIEPDIVLVDVTSEQALHDTRAAYIHCQNTPFVALAVPEIPQKVIACADAGFVAYVPRTASVTELVSLVTKALKGECPCNPKIVGSLFQEVRRRHSDKILNSDTPTKTLTLREGEILGLMGQGLSNKAIARQLNVSLSTVKNHLHNAFTKLQVNRRTEALARLKNEPWLMQHTTTSLDTSVDYF